MEGWNRSSYCSRDEIVFDSQDGVSAPVIDFKAYLYR